MANVTASDVIVKASDESKVYTFNFTAQLDTSETLSSVTSCTELVTSDLTIGTASVYGGGTVDGVTIAASKAVRVRISGGTSGETYTIACVCATSDSDTERLNGILKVEDT